MRTGIDSPMDYTRAVTPLVDLEQSASICDPAKPRKQATRERTKANNQPASRTKHQGLGAPNIHMLQSISSNLSLLCPSIIYIIMVQ